jgi:succinate dehydrogenase/fumarate reductase flavoprotein subunit
VAHRKDADIIVVGTGAAGLMAAITAADEGAKVLEIEKRGELGGTFLISQGTSAGTQTRMQFEEGILNDSPTLFYMDCMKESRAREVCDPEILMFYCQNSGFAVDWLDSRGAYAPHERKCAGTIYGESWSVPRIYRVDWAISYLKVILAEHEKRVARGDIRYLLNTKVTSLIREGGRVAGVTTVDRDNVNKTYRAGAVIMATGGWSGNLELMRKFKFPGARAIINVGLPDAKGEGMMMCEAVGAKMVNMDQELLPYIGTVRDPKDSSKGIAHINMNSCPGAIWVDLNGRRVVSEEGGQYLPPCRIAMFKAPEMTLFVIFDEKMRRENVQVMVSWLGTVPERSWQWIDERAAEGEVVFKANTIEELARKAHIMPENLKETVMRWNGFVDAGKDADFGRQNVRYKLDTPPFYAIETVPANLISAGGPATNVRMQVIDTTGKVIPGLYAAGEITGYRAFGTGSLNTGCLVFGKQAGLMAAHEVILRRPTDD